MESMGQQSPAAGAMTESALRSLLASLPGMAYRCQHDADWTLEYVSQGCIELVGYSPEDLVDRRLVSFSDLIHPDDLAAVSLGVEQAIALQEPFQFTYRLRTRDGALRWAWERGRGVFDESDELVAIEGFVFDVTEHRQAEADLHRAQRLDAVGRVVGEIAHDFNNQLTVILGAGELIRGHLAGRAAEAELRAMLDATTRATEMTRKLLSIGRRRLVEPAPNDLHAALRRVMPLLERMMGEGLTVRTELAAESFWTQADPGQVEQLLSNLLLNARDATPADGGPITVRTRNLVLEANSPPGARPGPHLLLEVEDSGTGIEPQNLEHVFDPYFTTKAEGEGTGLGLAVVFGIVRQSGGAVDIESDRQGTTVRVYLPLMDVQQFDRPVAGRVAEPTGDEVMLLAEDNPAVRGVLSRSLRGYGYTVLEARDGLDAVRIAERHKGPLDLLLADIQMPRMGGIDLARRLRGARPGLKVLFMTGREVDAAPDPADPADPVLIKPVKTSELAASIRSLLG